MALKLEGGKGPISHPRYYYLEYSKTLKIKNNYFDNSERKSRNIWFIQVVNSFCLQPNLETSRPFLGVCTPLGLYLG